MKNTIFLILSLLLVFNAEAQKQMVVDPNAEIRNIDKSFSGIKVSDGIDLYLSQSDKESIAVSASEKEMIAGIKTVVEGDILRITYEGKRAHSRNRKVTVYVSFLNLSSIQASGASDISIAGTLKGNSLKLNLSGASDFKGDVVLSELIINSSGASDVKLSGTATTLSIESSGASDIKAYDLVVDNCTARVSGASDVNITVNKELHAVASGASNIFYKGTAQLKESQSGGASSISKKE